MNTQIFNQSPTASNNKHKILFIPTFIISVLILATIIFYLSKNKKATISVPTPTTSNAITNWKVFEDNEFGFSFQYPQEKSVTVHPRSFDISQRSIDIGDVLNINLYTTSAFGSNPKEYEDIVKNSILQNVIHDDNDFKPGSMEEDLGSNKVYQFITNHESINENVDFGATLKGLTFTKDYVFAFYYDDKNEEIAKNIIKTISLNNKEESGSGDKYENDKYGFNFNYQ